MSTARAMTTGSGVIAWVRAMRLQFYPMTWLAYALGAAMVSAGGGFDAPAFGAGLAVLVLFEMATVFTNELVDLGTDRRNPHAGPFNGGSRVLVDGRLPAGALHTGAVLAISAGLLSTAVMLALAPPGGALAAGAVVAVFGLLALEYTLPPLRLAYRGLGEITVAATHSIGPLLLGYVLQGGAVLAPAPWLLSLPLLLSILPSIALAGIPDSEADRAVGKRTMAVRHNPRGTAAAAVSTAVAAALAAGAVALLLDRAYGVLGLAIPLHCLLLTGLTYRYLRRGAPVQRIDGLLVAALTYLVWFVVPPLLVQLR